MAGVSAEHGACRERLIAELAVMHDHVRQAYDAAWQQDGQIGFLDEPPSRKRLDNIRDLFRRAAQTDALYRLCLGAFLTKACSP